MSAFSQVGVAIKPTVELSSEVWQFLTEYSTARQTNEEGSYYHFDMLKWYRDNPKIDALYVELSEFDDNDYAIVVVSEYAEDDSPDSLDAGCWDGGAIDIGRAIRVTVFMDMEGANAY